MAVREIRIDRGKPLTEEPGNGHNRWHPDIAPLIRCQPGDEVVLETRDAFDGQMGPDASPETVAAPNLDVVHPLTGPVHIEGAEPGDVLDAEILDVEPDRYGYTVQVPGFGFARDAFPEPFKVNWDIADGWATQAYAICSIAVDLKISQLLDAPNMLVSAFLPENLFTG